MSDRHKVRATGLRLPQPLLDEIDHWCAAQRPPVTRTGLVRMVLEDWLAAQRGHGTAAQRAQCEGRRS